MKWGGIPVFRADMPLDMADAINHIRTLLMLEGHKLRNKSKLAAVGYWLENSGSAHARQEQPTATSEESTNNKKEEEQ